MLSCCGLAFLLTGCVALNIPSARFADPDDRGGVLGHWSKRRPAEVMGNFDAQTLQSAAQSGIVFDEIAGGVPCNQTLIPHPSCDSAGSCGDGLSCGDDLSFGGGALSTDPFGDYDPETSNHGGFGPKKPKPKPGAEIPWPRFHPIPTRPVFGVSSP